ncbi:MAG: DUF4382 domain-containing protein [Bacteroidales bacterium]
MKRIFVLISVIMLPFILFTSCEKDNGDKGTLNLSITDAPIDSDGITGVFIKVSEVHYHVSEINEWQVFEDYEGPKSFNLLDLQRGESDLLGSFELEAGTYTQLRFLLDAPLFDAGPMSNPGCYLLFEDESTQNLFVPSGAQTGYKAVGAFTVPINGSVDVTADFDVRKSVVKAGASGKYILKPTIRLIVDNQAGVIAGGVTNIPEGHQVIVYAYETGAYDPSEADEPAEEQTRFPNAITSDIADESGAYHLAYLAPGIYDLVVTSAIEGEFQNVLGTVDNIVVESKETTSRQINIDDL